MKTHRGSLKITRDLQAEQGVIINEQSVTPSNPATGYSQLYFKGDGKLYGLNSAGTEVQISNEAGGDGNPVGTTIAYNAETVPAGYLKENGQEVSMTTYEDLYDVIGSLFGKDTGVATTADSSTNAFTSAGHGLSNGDVIEISASLLPIGITADTKYFVINSDTNTFQVALTAGGAVVTFTTNGSSVKHHTDFRVNDKRSEALRGWADNRTDVNADETGRAIGSYQADQFKSHNHSGVMISAGTQDPGGSGSYEGADGSTNHTGGLETRMRNIAVLFCIKY